jgi:hypothetical protein
MVNIVTYHLKFLNDVASISCTPLDTINFKF